MFEVVVPGSSTRAAARTEPPGHVSEVDEATRPGPPSRAAVPAFLQHGAAWAWRFIVVAVALYIALRAVVVLRVVVIPIFVALLVAALLNPVVERLARRMPRLLATWITLLTVATSLGLLGWLLAAPIAAAAGDFTGEFDRVVADVESWLQTGPLSLSETQVDDLSRRIGSAGDGFVSGLIDEPGSTARLISEVVGGFFLALVVVFFCLKDGPEMWRWMLRRVKPVRRDDIDRAGRAAFGSLQGWLKGIAITGLVDAVLIGIALVVLGVPAALPLAVLTFFAAFFPIVGATLAGLLAVGIAAVSQGPTTALILAAVVLAIQQIEGDVLLPLVMRRQVQLHPVVILIALGVGAALAGIVGALVAVPVTAAVVAAISVIRANGDHSDELYVPGAEGAAES
ncbi:MAG: AI-2E family transporter [Ilumatobacter sp.]|nr:AI-2E family transporter [Ilumatobacter sp.]